MAKVLVTGATGNVGTYVVKELIKKGNEVVAADTSLKKLKSLFDNEVNKVLFDFTKRISFKDALENVDRVFLMRPPSLGDPQDLYPFIDAVKDKGIKLISFLSLMGVENNPIPPHHKIEKYIEKSGVPYAHVRPSFFMQNISGVHSVEIKNNDEIFIPAGRSKTSFIDAADIGLTVAILLSNPRKYRNTVHTITGAEALDYYQVADILSEVTGREISYTKPGFLKYRYHYINKRGLNKTYVNVTVALYFMTRMGAAKQVTDEFYQLTGKQPKTLKEFAIDNKDAFVD
ncbi:MAG: SDR family oxidoreductase [Clostridia bacterium]